MRIRGFLIRGSQILGIVFWLLILSLVVGCGGGDTKIVEPENEMVWETGVEEGAHPILIQLQNGRLVQCIVYKEYVSGVSVSISCDWSD